MYFLTPLLLSGALAAAQDVNESASTSKSVIDTLKTSTAPAGSIKTVFTTVTRTLYPITTHLIPSYPPPTTEISSHFAMPPSVTSSGPAFIYESTDLGAGPIYDDTSLAPHNVHTAGFAPWHPYSSLSGQREFAFVASSTTILFEGHYTPKTSSTKSYCEHRSTGTTPATLLAATTSPYPRPTRSNLDYAPSPSSASYTASSQPYASSTRSSVGYASTPGQSTVSDGTMGILPIHTVIASDETVDIMPIPTPTDNNFDIMSLPDEEESVGILPLPNAEETMDVMPLPTRNPVQTLPITSASPASSKPPNSTLAGFKWPAARLNASNNSRSSTQEDSSENEGSKAIGLQVISHDDHQEEAKEADGIDNSTARSGIDAAVPAQLHDPPQARTIP